MNETAAAGAADRYIWPPAAGSRRACARTHKCCSWQLDPFCFPCPLDATGPAALSRRTDRPQPVSAWRRTATDEHTPQANGRDGDGSAGSHARGVDADSADSLYAQAAASYDAARHSGRAEDWQQAIAALERFAADHPHHPRAAEATLFAAEALHTVGQFPQARRQYEQFLARYLRRMPLHESRVRFRLGESAYLAGQYDQAQAALQRYREQFPRDSLLPNALIYLGNMALEQDQHKTAADYFAQALLSVDSSTTPANSQGRLKNEALFGLARARAQEGDRDAARQLYRQLLEQQDTWLADHALYQLALCDHQANNHSAVQQSYDQLAARFPASPRLSETRRVLVRSLLKQEKYEQAIQQLDAPLGEDARTPPGRPAAEDAYLRGLALMGMGHHEKALQAFGTTNPADPPAHLTDGLRVARAAH